MKDFRSFPVLICAEGLFLVFVLIVAAGCVSFDSSESAFWTTGDGNNTRGTVRIISVSVERSGEWSSIEKEISDLLPLLFSEEAYLMVSPAATADYSAEVKVREREYPDGWETRRSLSAEVRLWPGDSFFEKPLPLSAGRALNHGKQSLASSKTLCAMLRKAVKNAVQGLSRVPPKDKK